MLNNKILTVVIPAYNEEKSLVAVISAVPGNIDNIIVVDDGSIDKTAQLAQEKGAILLRHDNNKGLGAAFRTGLKRALELNTDIMINIDADGQFNPANIPELVRPIIEGRADFVTASRFKDMNQCPQMSKIKFLGNRFMSFIISKLLGQKYYDVSCGFRAYSREALLRLNLFGSFTYTQETFLDLAFKGLSIVEIPVAIRGTREHGQSKIASNLFNYAYQTIKIILKTLRDYRTLRVFAFLSLTFLIIGLIFGLFILVYYFRSQSFFPYKWMAFTSGFFILLALVTIATGFVVDMFARIRHNQEEILYLIKKDIYSKNK